MRATVSVPLSRDFGSVYVEVEGTPCARGGSREGRALCGGYLLWR